MNLEGYQDESADVEPSLAEAELPVSEEETPAEITEE